MKYNLRAINKIIYIFSYNINFNFYNNSFEYKIGNNNKIDKMRWRNQIKSNNPLHTYNNKTLDSFMNGMQFINKKQPQFKKGVAKIKIPHSSGFQPSYKPIVSPFLYPLYPQLRQYQYNISLKCVTQNTLVCLPTGLGKTHIASVMIINYHIWFPEGLIFFLAPTKPLVDQQSMSLSNYKHLINPNSIFSLTGSIQSQKRIQVYKKKKILFCTPQTLQNDIKQYRFNTKNIVLIIFDQAHKATGNYSYANIIRLLNKQQFGYRIIGLSATPGSDNQRIQQVIQNLQITNMIIKTDDDQDVKKYIKKKKIQPIFIMFTDIISQVDQILRQFISWPLNQLLKFHLFDKNLAGGKYGFNANCFYLINQQINQRLTYLPYKYFNVVQQAKTFLKFMADSQSILRQSGYDSFKRKFIYQIDGIQQNQNILDKFMPEKQKIHPNFIKIIKQHSGYRRIKQLFSNTTNIASHPKLQKLRNLLYQFFTKPQNIQKKSKVIVFASLRFTCHQINKYLSQAPFGQIIKSQIFLGQAKTTVQTRDGENSIKQTLKLSQKQQISLIKRYKANQLNTLISTSIGEQGLDIGQVDAIFCYQGGMSTIRMVQRMGRTGRKRDGIVYMLLMQGKQSDDYQKASKKTQRMKKLNTKKFKFYSFNPALFQQHTEIPVQFFNKPQEKQQKQVQSQADSLSTNGNQTDTADTKKSKITKRKKNSKKQQKDKNNNKKTKKNKKQNKDQNNQKIQQIQQVTKSQQCSQQKSQTINNNDTSMSKNLNNINSLIQKYSKFQTNQNKNQQNNKYFKIIGNQTIIPNFNSQQFQNTSQSQQQQSKQQNSVFSYSQQQSQQNNQQSKKQSLSQLSNQNKFPHQLNPIQMYHTQIQYTEQQLSKCEINYIQNQKFKRDKGFKQFDKLFDLDKLLLGDDLEQQENIKVKSLQKQKQSYKNQQNQSDNHQVQPCPNFGQSQNSKNSNNSIKCESCEQIQILQNSLQILQIEEIKSPQFPQSKYLNQQNIKEMLNTKIDLNQQELQQLSQQTKKSIQLTKYMQKKRQQDGNFKYILDQIRKIEEKEQQERKQAKQRKQRQQEQQRKMKQKQQYLDRKANKKPIQYLQRPYQFCQFTPKDRQKFNKNLQNIDLDSIQQSKSSSQKNKKYYHKQLLKLPQPPTQPQKIIELLTSSQKVRQIFKISNKVQNNQTKEINKQQEQQYDELQQLFAQHDQIKRQMSQRQNLSLGNQQTQIRENQKMNNQNYNYNENNYSDSDSDSDGLQQLFRQHQMLKLQSQREAANKQNGNK